MIKLKVNVVRKLENALYLSEKQNYELSGVKSA